MLYPARTMSFLPSLSLQTDGWPAHLASDAGAACQRSTRPSRLMGGPLTMWLHRAERRCH